MNFEPENEATETDPPSPFDEDRQDDGAEPGPDVDGGQPDDDDDPDNAPDAPDPEQARG